MWVRLLSFFHLIFPILLLWLLLHVGYDRHGWILQSGVAVVVLAICRLAGSELNINFAFRDPLFNRSWGPAPLHLVVITSGLISLIYWPTHVVLARFLSPPGKVH